MVNKEQFIEETSQLLEWIANYFQDVENFPVRSKSAYGDLKKQLPENPPEKSESMEIIFKDFKQKVIPGITHWQSPKFFAYFPANGSIPSLQAEFLTAALGVQGMKWVTSPAATELEQVMMNWLRQMIGLPEHFTGVIQDTASVSTLCAVLAAREKTTGGTSNEQGVAGNPLRIYCSSEAHSSIEKAVRIAGIGSRNLVKIPVDEECRLVFSELESAIRSDLEKGYRPCCVIGALGTTGSCAIDPLDDMAELCSRHGIWFHVDAAFAGNALILPEFRKHLAGFDKADSFVFNPHKWMFTNFDCSAFFVRDSKQLQKTFELVPEYLKTGTDQPEQDFSNFGIQLGRRFRALKLWFVIRNFGLDGIREKLRGHFELAEYFEQWVKDHPRLELVVPRNLVVVCFRFRREGVGNEELNRINAHLLEAINTTGKIYISHTFVNGCYTLRFVCAQTNTELKHVEEAIKVIDQCLSHI
ncbi:MAG: hypothetical protein JW801_05535 [Bacteroidales bacterium]|nr:hypothetical protein [Bacteroidales bacterium]